MASSRAIWVLIAVTSLASCEKTKLPTPPKTEVAVVETPDAGPPKPEGPTIVKDEGPMPTADTPIAKAGDFVVTVGDFEEASAISLLFAPDDVVKLPEERLALPHVHVTMARSLLSQKIISAELERRGLSPTTAELNAYLREHPRLGRFGQHIDDPEALAESLKPLGLEQRQLLRVAWEELGNKLLAASMVNEIKDDEIWETYRAQNTTRTAIIVGTRNLPTSDEIDAWMGDHADEIDKQYQEHQSNYRIPRRVKLNIVKPEPGKHVSNGELEEAAKMLKGGVQPETIAKELNLQFELESQLVRGENPKAFSMKPGEVGWMPDGARGAYAWKVVGFEESKLPEMTRALRREIAAELLRTTAVVPSVKAKLEAAAKILSKLKLSKKQLATIDQHPELLEPVQKQIEAIEGLGYQVAKFTQDPNAPLPVHGLAEDVVLTSYGTDVGKTSGPFISRERGFIVRPLVAHDASRKEFDARIDANRKAFVTAMEPRIVTQWVERRMRELGATIDVKPLRIKFGVLQKD